VTEDLNWFGKMNFRFRVAPPLAGGFSINRATAKEPLRVFLKKIFTHDTNCQSPFDKYNEETWAPKTLQSFGAQPVSLLGTGGWLFFYLTPYAYASLILPLSTSGEGDTGTRQGKGERFKLSQLLKPPIKLFPTTFCR